MFSVLKKTRKFSSVLYRLIFEIHKRNIYHSRWLCFIEKILNSCGFSHFWLAQYVSEN